MTLEGHPSRRPRLSGLHHITLICRQLERTIAFYRDLLGMRVVKQTRNPDDPNARHVMFGDMAGTPGTLVTFLEYPQLDAGAVGAGSTHHFALSVDSLEELQRWHSYLLALGVPCSEPLDRTYFRSLYLRDPDGHIVELATRGPGVTVDERIDELGQRAIVSR